LILFNFNKGDGLELREQPVVLKSEGHQLIGMHHRASSVKIVIFCHGFTGSKCENKRLFVEAARAFTGEGYSALRFDFYGSGDSEGEFRDTTVSRNIQNLHDAMTWAQSLSYSRIAVLGFSLGAAAAILALAERPADALITWCAVPDMDELFDTFDDIDASASQAEYNGWLVRRSFREDAVQHKIKPALAVLTCPKLIVQGMADSPLYVNGFYSFQRIVQPPADFFEVPEAGHTMASPAHRRQVIRQTRIWLARHF